MNWNDGAMGPVCCKSIILFLFELILISKILYLDSKDFHKTERKYRQWKWTVSLYLFFFQKTNKQNKEQATELQK